MPTSTPLYGLLKFAAKEPAGMVAAIVNASVDKIEQVLQGAGIVPPSADLTAMLAQLSAFNTRNTAGEFTDSGWVAVTVTSPAVAITGAPPQVRKIGKRVIARGGFAGTGQVANTATASGTIPAGYRPPTTPSSGTTQAPATLEFAPGMSSAGSTGKIVVTAATGVVQVAAGGSVAGYFRLDGMNWTVD